MMRITLLLIVVIASSVVIGLLSPRVLNNALDDACAERVSEELAKQSCFCAWPTK